MNAVIKGADARQHHPGGVRHLFGPDNQPDLGADFEQRFVHAAQVAGAVINQRNHAVSLECPTIAGNFPQDDF